MGWDDDPIWYFSARLRFRQLETKQHAEWRLEGVSEVFVGDRGVRLPGCVGRLRLAGAAESLYLMPYDLDVQIDARPIESKRTWTMLSPEQRVTFAGWEMRVMEVTAGAPHPPPGARGARRVRAWLGD